MVSILTYSDFAGRRDSRPLEAESEILRTRHETQRSATNGSENRHTLYGGGIAFRLRHVVTMHGFIIMSRSHTKHGSASLAVCGRHRSDVQRLKNSVLSSTFIHRDTTSERKVESFNTIFFEFIYENRIRHFHFARQEDP